MENGQERGGVIYRPAMERLDYLLRMGRIPLDILNDENLQKAWGYDPIWDRYRPLLGDSGRIVEPLLHYRSLVRGLGERVIDPLTGEVIRQPSESEKAPIRLELQEMQPSVAALMEFINAINKLDTPPSQIPNKDFAQTLLARL